MSRHRIHQPATKSCVSASWSHYTQPGCDQANSQIAPACFDLVRAQTSGHGDSHRSRRTISEKKWPILLPSGLWARNQKRHVQAIRPRVAPIFLPAPSPFNLSILDRSSMMPESWSHVIQPVKRPSFSRQQIVATRSSPSVRCRP